MKSFSLIKTIVFLSLLYFNVFITTAQNPDNKALKIAENVVNAMGGRENYNSTRFIQWDFAKRTLYWDKWTGNVRIEAPEKHQVILVNINTLTGKVYENDTLVTDKNKIESLLQQGKNWWINDSYWLVMPWKLQDPGVSLKYVEVNKIGNGHLADVLQLTFNNVGVTPQNKYYVYVDQEDRLIKQWAFFTTIKDKEAKFTLPWDNYQKMENILLSFNRSQFGPKNVVVKQAFNENLFTELNYN